MIRKKIKKILVPLDGSKNSMRGLDEGIYLARQCQATITGLYVIPIYPRNLFIFQKKPKNSWMEQKLDVLKKE
jgi:nucleotide-binding universal stress UspA family protein